MAKINVDIKGYFVDGNNTQGIYGDGTTSTIQSLTEISGNWKCVFLGGLIGTAYGISQDGTLWGWGNGQSYVLGNNCTSNFSSPILISSINNWNIICNKNNSVYGLTQNGCLYVWGVNQCGNMGVNPGGISVQTPTNFSSGVWCKVSIYNTHSGRINNLCCLTLSGNNIYGQLGNCNPANTICNYTLPISQMTDVSVGCNYTLAIRANTQLWSWGDQNFGKLARSGNNHIPCLVSSGWSKIFASVDTSYGIKSDNSLWSFGSHLYGASGIGLTTGGSFSPIQIPGTWLCVFPRQDGALAIDTDNRVFAWGRCPTRNHSVNLSTPVMIGEGFKTLHSNDGFAIQAIWGGEREVSKEYNKNDNKGTWTLNKIYNEKISDKWSDFIPTIDD